MSSQIIDRDLILQNAERESEISDLKQHADKMIRGFENFNDFSSNRAVWEMVQNACDLSKDCEVLIDYSGEGFSFTHNGKPFTTKSLISLIKQVSGKYGEETDITEVGKYGTGFLTTHTFGRKFFINSILEAEGAFFKIKDFLIDRSPRVWKDLSDNIRIQKNNVYSLIKEGTIVTEPAISTTFTFIPETDQEKYYIAESSRDLVDYIPIVLTINNRLKKVVIKDSNGTETTFIRLDKQVIVDENDVTLFRTKISRNGEEDVLFSLIDEENEIEVILPIDKNLKVFEFSERVARLFLYYPLIGSEHFGFNFIVNCTKFLPTEARDGIHLKSNKDQVKEQEEHNRLLLEKVSHLIFDFLKSSSLEVINPMLYARINFRRNTDDTLLNEYFETLQRIWTDQFAALPIVETAEGYKSVNETNFWAADILTSARISKEVYELTSQLVSNIPVEEKMLQWSTYVNEWEKADVGLISHESIVKSVSEKQLSDFRNTTLITYYKTLIEEENKHFFSTYAIIPNLDGEFCHVGLLLTPKSLTPELIEIGRVLIPNSIAKLVHSDFRFDFHFEDFSRKDFSTTVKSILDELQISEKICLPTSFDPRSYHAIEEGQDKIDIIFFTSLLNYCKLQNNPESKSKPATLVRIISNYYGFGDSLLSLPSLEIVDENLDIRSARKILVKAFFNLLAFQNVEWVKREIDFLLEIANCFEDSLKEAYLEASIYPNQMGYLKKLSDLKRDIDVTEEIKDLYNRVSGDEVRNYLVYRQFNSFIAEDRYVTNKYLAIQIEDIFFTSDIHDINRHPFKEDILKIISKLRIKEYAEMFQRLDDKKANLMLEIVTNERTKDYIFSIVSLKEDQLRKLGNLINEKNFEAILRKAEIVLQQEKEHVSDFRHKYEIGVYIEKLIREKLSDELKDRVQFAKPESIEASNVQGGQDIIILLDGTPAYYIEVKSRWSSSNSVSMSKLQLERAVEKNENYALCSVDISRYVGDFDKYTLPVEEVLPLTKFVTGIGTTIKPLIEVNLEAEKNIGESIHLIDYRGIIPQDILQKGHEFDAFVEDLSNNISLIATESYSAATNEPLAVEP